MSGAHESPRKALVRARSATLIEIAAGFGARRVALTGSVARGDDTDASDIDFYVWEFDDAPAGTIEGLEARQRADELVKAYRALLLPYAVDVRGIPGWLLDPAYDVGMQRDAIELDEFLS